MSTETNELPAQRDDVGLPKRLQATSLSRLRMTIAPLEKGGPNTCPRCGKDTVSEFARPGTMCRPCAAAAYRDRARKALAARTRS
jgi:uncharacterized protein (DUF983 family)